MRSLRVAATSAAACMAVSAALAPHGAADAAAHPTPHAASGQPPALLGEMVLPTGEQFVGTEVGGLSGLTYDAHRARYYAIADDRSQIDPARFYTLTIDVADGAFDRGDVTFIDVTTLRGPGGQPFPPGSLDPEGIALTKDDTLVITSEGDASQGIDPWVRIFGLDGHQLASLPVPDYYNPTTDGSGGIRDNLAFESAGVTPNGRFLFTATESALFQDGPASSLTASSPSRILRCHLPTGRLDREYVYQVEPVPEPPSPPGAFAVNGLVELIPLNNQFLLAMERAFSVGAGNTVRLYLVKAAGATDVQGDADLSGDLEAITPVSKKLVLDLDTLGLTLDNLEGMTLGPRLPDGRRALLLVSDNNFSTAQFTQFLAFAI